MVMHDYIYYNIFFMLSFYIQIMFSHLILGFQTFKRMVNICYFKFSFVVAYFSIVNA